VDHSSLISASVNLCGHYLQNTLHILIKLVWHILCMPFPKQTRYAAHGVTRNVPKWLNYITEFKLAYQGESDDSECHFPFLGLICLLKSSASDQRQYSISLALT